MSLLNWFGDNCPACTRCVACDNPWCRDDTVSPGEGDGICTDCFETEDPA